MIWAEEVFEIGRKFTLNFGEDLSFFIWRLPVFGRKNRLNFRFRPKNFWRSFFFFGDHLFLAKNSTSISDKPFESDSKAMKIRVKDA